MERGRKSGTSDRSSGRSTGGRPPSSGRPASGGRPPSSGRPASGGRPPSSSASRPRSDETSTPSGRPVYGNTGRPTSPNSGRPSYSDRPTSDRRPSTSDRRPSTSDRRPASGGRPPSSSASRPRSDETSTPSGRPVYRNTGRPTSPNSGRPTTDRRPSTSDRRPASSGGSGRPSYSDRPTSDRRPSTSDRRPASSGGSGRPSYSDRPTSDRRPSTSDRRLSAGGRPTQNRGDTWERPPLDRPRRAKIHEPNIPADVTGDELDRSITRELSTLSPANAKIVAQHLVAAGLNLDSNPKLALEHARAAVYHAGRIASVRESLGIAAYMSGEFAEALAEFRAAMRISGDVSNWSMMADCERGLGRPAKALAMAGAPEASKLDKSGQIELRIVTAGARRDMGELEAAIVTLTCPELNTKSAEWSGRLRYAYADALLATGREEEALIWFLNAAASDPEQLTDAVERIDQLNGITFDLDEDDSTNDDTDGNLEV